jgi:protoheme IX farnesyltransferase
MIGGSLIVNQSINQKSLNWKMFYRLAKPGIVYSNSFTVFGGFWLASKWEIDWFLFAFVMIGAALVIASGCVFNNYLDREMDMKMSRTQNRELPSGLISPKIVLWYGSILGFVGLFIMLVIVQSWLATLISLLGLIFYVLVYTVWFKRVSIWSTFVGSISGSTPPIIGYCAVTQTFDIGAVLLFLILFLWQPPHFWSLGIRRMEEYRAAGFPLLPVVRGSYVTKISMIRYLVLLVPVTLLLHFYGYVGQIYLMIAAASGLIWILLSIRGFLTKDDDKWSKGMFVYSINYLILLFICMILDTTRL